MKFKAFLILLLLSIWGSYSFASSSHETHTKQLSKKTNKLLKKMGIILEERDPYQPLHEPFGALLRSGFSKDSRPISRTSGSSGFGYRFRMNLDYLYHMLQQVKGKTVVVLGASSGEEGLLALLFGASEVVLNDLSLTELEQAETLYKELKLQKYCPHGEISFVSGDCLTCLPEKQFDFVLAHNLVHFFDGAQMNKFKTLMGRLTKPGSFVYLTANPCSHTRYKSLNILRTLKESGKLPKEDARLKEIHMTIGSFQKSSLLAANPSTRTHRDLFIDPGYDKGEQFYQDEDFPHNGKSLSEPLPGTIKFFRNDREINTLLQAMNPCIKAIMGLSAKKLVQRDMNPGEILVGMTDTRLRRVFTPLQLAELLAYESHSLFAVESYAFFDPSAVAPSSDGQSEVPVQVCCEENTFAGGDIPDFLLEPSKHNIIALPCVILRAVDHVKPFSIPMTEEDFKAL